MQDFLLSIPSLLELPMGGDCRFKGSQRMCNSLGAQCCFFHTTRSLDVFHASLVRFSRGQRVRGTQENDKPRCAAIRYKQYCV